MTPAVKEAASMGFSAGQWATGQEAYRTAGEFDSKPIQIFAQAVGVLDSRFCSHVTR
jgi:hypothetical protein